MEKNISMDLLNQLYCQEEKSVPEIAKLMSVKVHKLYALMDRYQIKRRTLTQSNYIVNQDKPCFHINTELTEEQKRLRLAGLMLYWAEGAKGGNTVDFTNSDPGMILIFLNFLREICGVAESRLRVFLYVYADQDIDLIRQFWSGLTTIPYKQFSKPYVNKRPNKNTKVRIMPYGVVHVRYNDKRLLQELLKWIDEESQQIQGGVTKAAKWT